MNKFVNLTTIGLELGLTAMQLGTLLKKLKLRSEFGLATTLAVKNHLAIYLLNDKNEKFNLWNKELLVKYLMDYNNTQVTAVSREYQTLIKTLTDLDKLLDGDFSQEQRLAIYEQWNGVIQPNKIKKYREIIHRKPFHHKDLLLREISLFILTLPELSQENFDYIKEKYPNN